MLRALWFLLKLCLLLAAVVWLIQRPGTVDIKWMGYVIETSVGFVAALLLLLIAVWTFIYRLWRGFVSVPAVFRRYQISTRREKGYRAVTSGFVAVAAGDARAAEKFTKQAEYMIPGMPLTKLLSAQTALMNGNAPKARRAFMDLLEDESAAFFGLRGLLNEHLRDGNEIEALALIRKADVLQPKRVWVVRTLFDLETRQAEWKKAEITLRRAERLNIFDAATARHHRQAIRVAESMALAGRDNFRAAMHEGARAFALDPAFAPAALNLVRLYQQADKRRAVLKTIEKAWRAAPHPDLAAIWMTFMPPAKRSASVYDAGRDAYAWMKQLADLKPEHRDSHRALGNAALRARLWKDARTHLLQAGDYKALAKLESDETGNDEKARNWLEMAADHAPDARWICTGCSHVLPQWSPLCPHCQAFNTIDWMMPNLDIQAMPDFKSALALSFDRDPFTPPQLTGKS